MNNYYIGKRVKIINADRYTYSKKKIIGSYGTVRKITNDYFGVEMDYFFNGNSAYGYFWFEKEQIKFCKNKEDNNMAKLEGYSKVAVIKYGNCPYCFAIYEDGNDYQIGDMVMLSGNSNPSKITEIITPEEAAERFSKNITAEVIGKVDISAYEQRVEQRKQKEKLKKELDKRKKEIQKKLDDEYYASKDEAYAEMLREYERL